MRPDLEINSMVVEEWIRSRRVEGEVIDFLFLTDDFSHSILQDDVGA